MEGYWAVVGERKVIIALPEMYYDDDGKERYGNEISDVVPETVCQYTGLIDKNGRKIFEGDVLSGKEYHEMGQGGEYKPDKCVIRWSEKHAAFAPVYWWKEYSHDLKHYEVIGNIFDNPELLDKETFNE